MTKPVQGRPHTTTYRMAMPQSLANEPTAAAPADGGSSPADTKPKDPVTQARIDPIDEFTRGPKIKARYDALQDGTAASDAAVDRSPEPNPLQPDSDNKPEPNRFDPRNEVVKKKSEKPEGKDGEEEGKEGKTVRRPPQYPKSPEDLAFAEIGATRKRLAGIVKIDEQFNTGELSQGYYADTSLVHEEWQGRKYGFYYTPTFTGTFQYSWDMPSLTLERGKRKFPLRSNGGGPFINPLTGRREYVTELVPKRINAARYAVEMGNEFVFRAGDAGTFRAYLEPVYVWDDKNSGLLEYRVKKFGSRISPINGDIESSATLEPVTKPERLDWKWYVRWAHDLNIGTDEHNTPIGVVLYAEGKPKSSDAPRETLLEAWAQEYGFMVISKATGLFVQAGILRDSLKLYFEKGWHVRFGVSLPFKSIFHILAEDMHMPSFAKWRDALADAFELDEHGMPIATTDYLTAKASKFTAFGEITEMKRPHSPVLGEFKPATFLSPGSIGPGGKDGKNIKASSLGFGVTMNLQFREDPFPDDPTLNFLFNRTEIQAGMQIAKYKVSGNDIGIRTKLIGQGSAGAIFNLTPPDLQPQVDKGTWTAFSAQVARDFPIKIDGKNFGSTKVGLGVDFRKPLGEVTGRSGGGKYIKTLVATVSYSPAQATVRTNLLR